MKKYLLILLLLVSCKPTQIITERVVTDSTAVIYLQTELSKQREVNESLLSENVRIKTENVKLKSESSSHKIEYDTDGEVNKDTGEYPKKSEEKTETKSELDRAVKEIETLKKEHNIEIKSLENTISNLNAIIDSFSEKEPIVINKLTQWQIVQIWLGRGLLIVLVLFLIFRFVF